jgi:hypothetical protein
MRTHRFLGFTVLLGLALSGCAIDEEESLGVETSPITPSPPFYGDPAKGAVFAVDVSHWEGPLAERELDCFWDSGVRHLVAGTQVEEVTRQQLAVAVSRGMTVDAYVYLYWDRDIVAQVKEAFKRSSGFPIGRLWLDVEEDPRGLGSNPLADLVQQAVDTCEAEAKGGIECGIYTGPGFWKTHMANTTRFASVPLWYAWYNAKKTLDAWSSEAFGGWALPTGKQWAEQPLCGCGVDKDTIQVTAQPTVVVDRSLPPDDGLPPPAPTRLYPADGAVIAIDMVKLMTATIPRATRTQLALERWDGTAFRTWYTWSVSDPFLRTYPKRNALYRFRARAQNARGWGAWSGWSSFDYGSYTGPRPGPAQNQPEPAPVPPPSTPAPTPVTPPGPTSGEIPTGLAPDGATLSSSSVAISCAPLAGATRYEIAIENRLGSGQYTPYVTYKTTAPSKVFYPQIHKTTYRFRIRAEKNGLFGGWSSFASFDYN